MNQCFDYRKFQVRNEANRYPWIKFTEYIPTRSSQQIKDKVRNLHFNWMQQQVKEKQEAIDKGEEFEEIVFEDLDSYRGELEQETVKEKEKIPEKVFSSVDRRKAWRLEQEAQKAGCDFCYVYIEKC